MPRPRSNAPILWLLCGVVALIAYGSLYPFNLKPEASGSGMLEALRQLSWARAGRGDRIANVLIYLPLGFCLFLALATRLRRIPAVMTALLLGSLLSLTIEVAQVYVSSRVPSLRDLALNALGTLLGAVLGQMWRALGTLMHLPSRVERPQRDPTAALLIALWIVWRFAPFVPHFDLAKLKSALQPLFDPQILAGDVVFFLACWFVISQAVASLVSRARSLEALLLLMATVLVGRLVVANQAFVAAELAALILLLPLIVLTHRMHDEPRRIVLVVSAASILVIEYLAPFDFGARSGRFDLWPFLAWFEAGFADSLAAIDSVALFGKLFAFGALLWVLSRGLGSAGVSLNLAIAAVTILALGMELAQLWLPGRTSSVTNPVLALGVGLAFRYVERRATARRAHTL